MYGVNVDDIEETAQVAGDTDVRAGIHHSIRLTVEMTNPDRRGGVATEAAHPRGAHDMRNAILGGRKGCNIGGGRQSGRPEREVDTDGVVGGLAGDVLEEASGRAW